MNANISEITTERGLVKRISLVSVGSTNDYAINLLRTENIDEETIVVAESQNKGKGQRGKQWLSTPGRDLCMSWILKSPPQPPAVFNMAAALGVLDGLREITGKTDISIKWPNDIIVTQNNIPKKISGLLIENTWRGDVWAAAIVGIGVNVGEASDQKHRPEFKLQATRIFDIISKHISPSSLEVVILNSLQHRVNNLRQKGGIKNTVSEFNSELFGTHSERVYTVNETTHKGVLQKVEEDGRGVFSWSNNNERNNIQNPETHLHSSEVIWSW
jgi:BirA family biotin operon repressor/biotin-[acetyl-CoA-carboxylase] ligase